MTTNYLQQYYQSASDCCRNCPCGDSPAGFQCQPYHLPGYLGHVPTMRGRFGHTFSRLTRDSLQDPCAPASPCPMLIPEECIRCRPMCCPCDLQMRGQLAPRCGQTDIYRPCESMSESYAGHVPGFTSVCLDGNPNRNTPNKIYLHNGDLKDAACFHRCNYDEIYCSCMDESIASQKRSKSESEYKSSKKSKSKKSAAAAASSSDQKQLPARSSVSRVTTAIKNFFHSS